MPQALLHIFESFATALQWILQTKMQVRGVSHIIDDFIFVGRANTPECGVSLQRFMDLCGELGVPIKHIKTVLPTSCAQVHGLELDTKLMEARLPRDKLEHLKVMLDLRNVGRKSNFTTYNQYWGI